MTNLPYLLTRWRLNPSGATHGNAGPQTEDCMTIRAKGFMKMTVKDINRANQLALALVRTFPAGSWFDERVSHLISNPMPSPALFQWRELAVRGLVSDLEVACVNWLHNEQNHVEQLAGLLKRNGLPWLEQLVLGKAGHVTMAPDETATPVLSNSASIGLTLLIPTQAGDHELIARVRASLDALPENAEIIVFSTDGTIADVPVSLLHHRLRVLPTADVVTLAWHQALSDTRGELIACMAVGCRHHPEFLTQSMAAFQSDTDCSLVYAPSDVYYPDALDCNGNPVKDPSPEPRWTRQTLLGRDMGNLSCMVFRRGLIGALPIAIEETGSTTSWAIARSLLTCAEPLILPLRNIEFAPKIELANNIMDVLIRRLVTWYLDTGLGSIPASWVWPQLSATQGLERVRELDARLLGNKLCIHPGNVSLISEFIVRFSRMPLFHPVFKHLLVHYPEIATGALRKRSTLAASLCGPWRLLLRGYIKASKATKSTRWKS